MTTRCRGAVLYLALVVVATLLVLASLALTGVTYGAQAQVRRADEQTAFYLAEAGRQRCLAAFAKRGRWFPTWEGVEYSLGPGTYVVTTSSLGVDQTRITSTGYLPNQAQAEATVIVVQDCLVIHLVGLKYEVVPYAWSRQ